jgi:hypothetical protein
VIWEETVYTRYDNAIWFAMGRNVTILLVVYENAWSRLSSLFTRFSARLSLKSDLIALPGNVLLKCQQAS